MGVSFVLVLSDMRKHTQWMVTIEPLGLCTKRGGLTSILSTREQANRRVLLKAAPRSRGTTVYTSIHIIPFVRRATRPSHAAAAVV